MQKVISDSSPLIHLSKIGYLRLLKDYFHRIVIPEAVYKECIVEGKNCFLERYTQEISENRFLDK
jgi:predicted nucleic acid-binding protein